MITKTCLSVFLFALLSLFAAPASAFTPDDSELADQVRKAYGPLTSWEAEMTFPEYPGVVAHIWYARGKWRQEWKAGDSAKAVGFGGNVTAKCTVEDYALSPLFVWMPPNPVESWRSWGVDNATSSFGFCEELPCLLYGTELVDDTVPSVQLNNEDMAPIQVRYTAGGRSISVRFSDYRTLGGFRVPEKVVTSFDSDAQLSATVKWIAVNRADDEALYTRESISAAPCAAPPEPFLLLRESFRYPATQ